MGSSDEVVLHLSALYSTVFQFNLAVATVIFQEATYRATYKPFRQLI